MNIEPKSHLDPEQFEFIDDVPVFAENDVKGKVYDEEQLQKIVEFNNEKVYSGNPPVIMIDHRSKDNPNPPVNGFMTNFYLNVRNGIKTIFSRLAIYKEDVDKLKRYPRRSVEFAYGSEENLVGVSLLGGKPPALNLGLLYEKSGYGLQFSKDEIEIESLNIFEKDIKMVDEEFTNKVLEVLKATDMYAFICNLMESKEETMADAEAPLEEEKMEAEDENKKKVEGEEDNVSDNEANDEADVAGEDDEDDDSYSMKEKLADLEKKYQRSEREKTLMVLQSAGHCFSLDEELTDSDDMNDTQFAKHCERIKKFTKQAPVGMKFSVEEVSVGGVISSPNAAPPQEMLEKAKRIAISKSIPFSEALKELNK